MMVLTPAMSRHTTAFMSFSLRHGNSQARRAERRGQGSASGQRQRSGTVTYRCRSIVAVHVRRCFLDMVAAQRSGSRRSESGVERVTVRICAAALRCAAGHCDPLLVCAASSRRCPVRCFFLVAPTDRELKGRMRTATRTDDMAAERKEREADAATGDHNDRKQRQRGRG